MNKPMTPIQASKMQCATTNRPCVSTICMAWRRTGKLEIDEKNISWDLGYCAVVGEPK